jgi:adenylosuccinate synthase
MTRKSIAVIGANYGDEGKGLLTDALVRRRNSTLVGRFNGGAQAGHTVVTPTDRHVFGHISAGTFAGADTYLSSNFLVNPLLLAQELKKFRNPPAVYANRAARVSTIFDMAMNNLVETIRGSARHGSCGVGINETVTRHAAGFELTVDDLVHDDPFLGTAHIVKTLKRIRDEWIPARGRELRLGSLDLKSMSTSEQRLLKIPLDTIQNLDIEQHARTLQRIAMEHILPGRPADADKPVILEGAQGLALDEFLGEFPHVTRSITGLPFAIMAAKELRCTSIEPVYCTRAYLTRHGAGPLTDEGVQFNVLSKAFPADTTNVDNQWQQKLRYAPLNLHQLRTLIEQDLERGLHMAQALGIELLPAKLAVTCLDQVDEQFLVRDVIDYHTCLNRITRSTAAEYIAKKVGLNLIAHAHGPESKDVQFVE